MSATDPAVEFFRVVPGAPLPAKADATALGTLPVAAYRYCAAVTEASRYGWYVFSPLEVQVAWDGHESLWCLPPADEWYPLTAVQHPGFAAVWDQAAPEPLRGLSPPFLSATRHPGVLQLWTGLFMRTAPGWSAIVRAPVNVPAAPGHELYEGIIETDEWFGPLFINLRLTKTDFPITLSADRPLFQVQPIPRIAYLGSAQDRSRQVDSLVDFSAAEWAAFARIMEDKAAPVGSIGGYATHVRRRSRTPP